MPADPWFGTHRLSPAAPAQTLRELLRDELGDTGWPYQPVLPAAPITAPRAAYAEVFRVAAALTGLLRRVALETAPTTAGRLAAYRMPAAEDQLWLRDPFLEERYATSVVRPDIVIGPDGPRFLEFNVSGALGGVVETHSRLAVWRKLYDEGTFHSPVPLDVRAAMFRDLAAELGAEPRIAMVGARVAGATERYYRVETDHYRAQGLHARFFEPDELDQVWDRPERRRYPIGLRNFTIGDWAEAGVSTAGVQRALDHGCLLVCTQTAAFLHHKRTMALLSEGRPWMTAAERALVHTYLPWTRIVAEGRTTHAGDTVDLVPHLLRHRADLVLKEGLGESGNEVLIGRDTDPASWEAAVVAAAGTGTAVVQAFVEPRRCRVALVADGADETYEAEVAPVLGPLLFGGRPAGMFCRFHADGSGGIVNVRGTNPSSDNVMVAV